ncbi:MAG: L,D-transpeptidase family protein [Candidatus Magasanikbacteria bacterium]|jgi:lipoprotein-anchoring transpeptidase ErfK/SrfK
MKKIIFLLVLLFIFFAHQVSAAEIVDTDTDGLIDDLEIKIGTDTKNPDTDGDGYKDGEEVTNGYNPLVGNLDNKVSRRVEVDLSTQKLKYYFNNILIGTAPVSTGKIGTDTPTGNFNIIRKLPVYRYVGPGYNLPNTKWNLEFKRSYFLHGAYWHNQFGIRPMSHGCVNIGYVDAEKIYKFLKVGDNVKVVGKTPRKALAKSI